jgi:hypothetical protein
MIGWLRRNFGLLLMLLLLSACGVDAAGNPTIRLFEPLLQGSGFAPTTLRLIYIVIGALLLIVGWRVYDVAIGLAGFLVGASIGYSLFAPPTGTVADSETLGLVGIIVGGLIGAGLAVILQYIAVFLIGGYLGAIVTSYLWVAMTGTTADPVVLLIGGLIGGIILVALFFYVAILVTSAVGAVMLAQGLGLGGTWMLIIFIVGAIIQFGLARYTDYELPQRRRFWRWG